jgi:hypothetical protein
MSVRRAALIQALRDLVAGGDITQDQLVAAVPDPRLLDRGEKAAWSALSHWADDGDIRAQYPRYGDQQLKVIAELARQLEV